MLLHEVIVRCLWLELAMNYFEGIRNCVVFALERSITGKDLVINAFNKDYAIKRIELFLP